MGPRNLVRREFQEAGSGTRVKSCRGVGGSCAWQLGGHWYPQQEHSQGKWDVVAVVEATADYWFVEGKERFKTASGGEGRGRQFRGKGRESRRAKEWLESQGPGRKEHTEQNMEC